jgi:hypothetical protein
MPTETPTAVSPKIVSVIPALIKVQPKQELIFTNDTDQFPEFEIKFLRASPASPDDKLTGTDSVTIHVEKTGTFPYMIIHTQAPDAQAPDAQARDAQARDAQAPAPLAPDDLHTGVFAIRSCQGGCK